MRDTTMVSLQIEFVRQIFTVIIRVGLICFLSFYMCGYMSFLKQRACEHNYTHVCVRVDVGVEREFCGSFK